MLMGNITEIPPSKEQTRSLELQERPKFRRMITQCRKKKIDLILTKSISRFGRNTVDISRHFESKPLEPVLKLRYCV